MRNGDDRQIGYGSDMNMKGIRLQNQFFRKTKSRMLHCSSVQAVQRRYVFQLDASLSNTNILSTIMKLQFPRVRSNALPFLLLLGTVWFFHGCTKDIQPQLKGEWNNPNFTAHVFWYALPTSTDEATLRHAADKLMQEHEREKIRIEMYFFRDEALAGDWSKAEALDRVLQGDLFDPSIALSAAGGGILTRDPDAEAVWRFFPMK